MKDDLGMVIDVMVKAMEKMGMPKSIAVLIAPIIVMACLFLCIIGLAMLVQPINHSP